MAPLLPLKDHGGAIQCWGRAAALHPRPNRRALLLRQIEQRLDLFVLTHIGADHIEGSVHLLRDVEAVGNGRVREVWFKWLGAYRLSCEGRGRAWRAPE